MQRIMLVVAREWQSRHTLTQMLREEGYMTLVLSDAVLALATARENPISVIFVDLLSLGQESLEFCRQVRATEETAAIPLVLLVANTAEEIQVRKQNPYVDEVLQKPVSRTEIRTALLHLQRRSRDTQRLLLVVAQDAKLRTSMVSELRKQGYLVLTTPDGAMALEVARENPVSLVILDALVLRQHGLDLCQQLQASTGASPIPVLLLVSSEIEITQLLSSNVAANDFLIKPFPAAALLACVQTLLRLGKRGERRKAPAGPSRRPISVGEAKGILVAGNLYVDVGERRVLYNGCPIEMGNTLLFDLLVYLLRHRDVILTREQLLRHVWGSEATRETRTVDVHIHWLRQKLHDDPSHPQLIQTIPGVGYRLTGESTTPRVNA